MDVQGWLRGDKPMDVAQRIKFCCSPRKVRLAAVNCVRHFAAGSWRTDPALFLALAERMADGMAGKNEISNMRLALRQSRQITSSSILLGECLEDVVELEDVVQGLNVGILARAAKLSALLRDVMRLRSGPVTWEVDKARAWEGGVIPRAAEDIYERGSWREIGVLGDMLEDAGVADLEVTQHCRGWEPCWNCLQGKLMEWGSGVKCVICEGSGWVTRGVPCSRGCWVIDTILGRL